MAVTIDAFRSGVSGLSSGSRIALRDDQVCKAGLRQRIACHFEGSVARMENLETINALKAAALNDPRYSGMRDKVEREFAAIDTSRMLRAKDVRNIFSNLDSRVFMNEDGRKLFLNREVKMRLLAISRPAAAGVQKAETDARWNFDFDDEWIRAPTAGKVSGPATSMQQWMPHIKELEPLVNRMIDNLAAEKGGIFNITAKDAADLTARIKDLLGRVADNLTSRSFPEEYHSRTISIMAQILASDPSSIVSENAVCCAANKLRVTLDELMFCRDVEGKTGIMEDAMDWMAFTGNSFWTDYELTVFATYHSELGEAVRGLGLSKSQADAILHMVPFESARKGVESIKDALHDANSPLRQMVDFPELVKDADTYMTAAQLLGSEEMSSETAEMKRLLLDVLAECVVQEGVILEEGDIEVTLAKTGEPFRVSWALDRDFNSCIVRHVSISPVPQK